MIRLEHITKTYDRRSRRAVTALNDVTFEAKDKGLVVILGHSGSGKSTLLSVIGGLDIIDSGSVTFGSETIPNNDDAKWDRIRREDIGYIFQNYLLLDNLTVFENVKLSLDLYGVEDNALVSRSVQYVLEAVSMYPYRKRRARQLSGGQKQRVAIARAIVKNPKVVIADEPTGNLDSKNTRDVMNIIKKISKDRLVILVTHEEAIAHMYADRIITMKDGTITSDAPNIPEDTVLLDDGDTFHLKDYPYHDKDRLMRLYADREDGQIPLSLTGVVKDGTLFIDADFPGGDVKLAFDAGIAFKDAHRTHTAREDAIETPFDPEELDNGAHRRKTGKRGHLNGAFKNALMRLLSMTRKGKALLLGFLLSGMIVAISASVVGNALFNSDALVDELEGYVTLVKQEYRMPYGDVVVHGQDDPAFWMNLYDNPYLEVSVPVPFDPDMTYRLEGSIDILDHVTEDDLIHGRMPEHDFEILVDRNVFLESDKSKMILASYGIWDETLLLGEKIWKMDRPFEIVGITDTPASRMYATRAGAFLLAHDTLQPASSYMPLSLVSDVLSVTHGRMPERGSGELLAPSTWYGVFIEEGSFDDGGVARYRTYTISGLYDPWPVHPEEKPFIGHIEDLERHVFDATTGDIDVYSSDPQTLLEAFREAGYVASWPYMDRVTEARNNVVRMSPLLIVAVMIVIFSGVGVYYMTRASIIPRIRDMAIRRALGTPAKALESMFLVETLLLTTLTSVIGFALGALLVLRAQDVSALSYLFHINGRVVIMGIVLIYLSNVLFSHVSVHRILFRKPAELLSETDM